MGDVILGIVITLLCLTPVFVAIGLPISQYLYRRQFKSVFTMDGANCLETKEGNVMIRPRTLRNWLFFVVLLLFLIGLIAAVISGIVGLINGTATTGIGDIIGLGIISILIGSAVIVLISQLRQTSVYINGDTNLLEIGSGASHRNRYIFHWRYSERWGRSKIWYDFWQPQEVKSKCYESQSIDRSSIKSPG
jgi:hypothetical protein